MASGGGDITEVWYQMMVDYWESRYYIEQTHGERELERKEAEEIMARKAKEEEEAKLAAELKKRREEEDTISSMLSFSANSDTFDIIDTQISVEIADSCNPNNQNNHRSSIETEGRD